MRRNWKTLEWMRRQSLERSLRHLHSGVGPVIAVREVWAVGHWKGCVGCLRGAGISGHGGSLVVFYGRSAVVAVQYPT
jgi:hypothetical protein